MAPKNDSSIATLLRACRRWQALANAQAELKVAALDELRKFDPSNPLLDSRYRNHLLLTVYRDSLCMYGEEEHIR